MVQYVRIKSSRSSSDDVVGVVVVVVDRAQIPTEWSSYLIYTAHANHQRELCAPNQHTHAHNIEHTSRVKPQRKHSVAANSADEPSRSAARFSGMIAIKSQMKMCAHFGDDPIRRSFVPSRRLHSHLCCHITFVKLCVMLMYGRC